MKKNLIVAGLLLAMGQYGNAQQKSDAPPPPPPPAPPQVMDPQKSVAKPAKPAIPLVPYANPDTDFLQKNKEVKSLHRKDDQLTVIRKDNTKETYDLNEKEDLEKFKAKYGELPEAPPPPPAPPVRKKA